MSRPTDRFGIGSLAAYDELISPMVLQSQLLGTADYLRGVNARQAQQAASQPQSIQDPAAAALMNTPTLREEFDARRETYRGILGDPEEQRKMTQAQMLFDIANTALAFSTAGSRPGMSPAERLAEAAVETKLFPTIAARTAAQREQQQKFDLAALQSAETSLAAKQKAAADLRKAALNRDPDLKMITFPGEQPRPIDVNSPFGRNILARAQATDGAIVQDLNEFGDTDKVTTETRLTTQPVMIGGVEVPANTPVELSDAEAQALPPGSVVPYSKDAGGLSTTQYIPTRDIVVDGQTISANTPVMLTDSQVQEIGDPTALVNFDSPSKQNNFTPNREITVGGRTYKPGDELALTPTQVQQIQDQFGLDALEQWDPETGSVQDNYLLSESFTLSDGTELAPNQVVSLTRAQAMELPKNTSRKLSGTPTAETWYDPKTEKRINVKNIGGDLFDMNQGGIKIDFSLPEYAGILELPENVTFSEFKLQQSQQRAGEDARELEQELLGQNAAELVLATPAQNLPGNQSFNQADQRLVYDAVEAARKGTGPYAQLRRSFNAIVGGLSPVETEFFSDTGRANNLIRTINVLGRVAVANSPRFAEGEQIRLAPLFPDPDAFITNPEEQVKKLVELKRYVEGEKLINLENLSKESDPTLRRQMKQQNYAIDSLLRLLEGVPRMGVLSSDEEAALEALRANQ